MGQSGLPHTRGGIRVPDDIEQTISIYRRDSRPEQWKSRPHWIWKPGAAGAIAEHRDEDPGRTCIMLGSWFYPLSIALIAHMLRDTGYEGPYRLNPMSLHECNVFSSQHAERPNRR